MNIETLLERAKEGTHPSLDDDFLQAIITIVATLLLSAIVGSKGTEYYRKKAEKRFYERIDELCEEYRVGYYEALKGVLGKD